MAEMPTTLDAPIDGQYAAGNAADGLFYENHPGGTGLTNAVVLGKVAAESTVEAISE